MELNELWAVFAQAALNGLLSAESDDFRFSHKADAAKVAASTADFMVAEYEKRFGQFVRRG